MNKTMSHSANFHFYDTLNDFLSPAKRNTWISYAFAGTPAVKDAIESIGVPHPEVDVILINGSPVPFLNPLHTHDQVEVYPAASCSRWPEAYSLGVRHPVAVQFILDVHLGKLAKALRMLGFDTCYANDYADSTIARIAGRENRIVLTRDIGLLNIKLSKGAIGCGRNTWKSN